MMKNNQHRLPTLIAVSVALIAAGATVLVSGLRPGGTSTDAASSNAGGTAAVVQDLAATGVPAGLPSGAPPPPTSHATVYCGSNAAERVAVDKARQARLLAQTFYIPKSHDARTPTTAADVTTLRIYLDDAIGKIYTGNAAAYVTDVYSRALQPESRASADTTVTAIRDVSGGVSSFECDSVSRVGSVMTVKVTGTSWAIIGELGSGGSIIDYAAPANTEHLTYMFDCDSTGAPLRITDFTSDFSG